MSQTASSNSVLDELSNPPESAAPSGFSFEVTGESAADGLMNEIFADVERMLERGVDLSEPAEPESVAIQTVAESADFSTKLASLTSRLSPRSSIVEQVETDEELSDLAELMAEVAPDVPQPRSIDKLLLSLMAACLVVTGGLWLYFRDRLAPTATTASPSVTASQPHPNQEFLTYVGRSLDRIERDAKAKREAAAIASTQPLPSPSVSVPAAPTVIERVYVPIYQSPASRPAPAAGVPAPVGVPAAPVTPNIAASVTHVLIGVLELGDRSAALFEINGTPQRIQMGAAIGSSGWKLVSVQNQEAIVRRNGEVRSIFIGQQF